MKRRKSRKWISLSVILSLSVSLLSGIGAVTIPSQAAGYGLSNPTTSGGVTTWDCVWFGNYWQNDTNGDGTANQSDKKQPIKWRVLSVNGDDAFLLADQCLDCQPYNTESTSVTWETCTLRTWLNQDFYSAAFSSAEQSAVKTTAVVNEDNPYNDTEGGNNTTDKVYLLSLSEVTNSAYGFSTDWSDSSDWSDSDKARYGKSTEYAKNQGAWVINTSTDSAGNSYWWLRSPGYYSDDAASVDNDGCVYADGIYVIDNYRGVRPALHLNLSSSQWSYAGTVSADGTGSETGAEPSNDSQSTSNNSHNDYVGKSDTNNSDFKIGSKVEFNIPSDVPIIGGGKCSLDFDNIPVQFNREGNTFQLGIGVSDLKKLKKDGWFTFKKFVETQKEDYRKGINSLLASKFGTATMGMSVKPKISCYGYVEGTITSDGVQSVGGKMMIEIKVKASQEWQTTVVVVPVVIKASGEVGVKGTVSVGFDFSKSSVYLNGKLDLTLPKIKLSAGVGVAYIADVSVYGSAENKISISSDQGVSASLTGELGVSAKAFCFSYEKALLKGTWNYYTGTSKLKNAPRIISSSAENEDEWEIDDTDTSGWNSSTVSMENRENQTVTTTILQNNTYSEASPKLLQTENGTKVLTYIAAINGRTQGNQYALVYSVYDEESRRWSEPKVVDGDETADFYPDAAVKGNEVYFTWCNLKEKISPSELGEKTPNDIASLSEIKVAKMDVASGTVLAKIVTNNSCLDILPDIEVLKNNIYLGYCENRDSDFLQMTGENNLHLGTLDSTLSYNELKSVDVDEPVKDLAVGELDNKVQLGYAENDGNLSRICLLDADREVKTVESTQEQVSGLSFAEIGGEQSLLWMAQNEDGSKLNRVISADGSASSFLSDIGLNGDYCVVNEEGRDIILCAENAGEDGGKITGYIWDGDVSDRIDFMQTKGNALALTAVKGNDNYLISYLDSVADIGENSVDTQTNLCAAVVSNKEIDAINNVDYLEEEFVSGAETTISVEVKNDGFAQTESGTYVAVFLDGSEVGRQALTTLSPGETEEIEVNLDLPDNIKKLSDFCVKIVKDEIEQDSYVTKVGSPDLSIDVSKNGDKADVVIQNESSFETEAVLEIYDTDEEGNLLDTINLGTLDAENSVTQEISLEQYQENGIESLMFVAKSAETELFTCNNTISVYIGENELKTLNYIQASKDKTAYLIGDKLTLNDLYVEAVYTDDTSQLINTYKTNADSINMSVAGEKTLTVEYEEVGEKRTVSIPIYVKAGSTTAAGRSSSVKNMTAGTTGKTTTQKSTVKKPAKVKSLKVKNKKKKKAVLTFKKVSGAKGYQIQYALNKKFTKRKKSKFTKKAKYTVKKLKKKKTYYFRVRAYKVVNGTKKYGKWSAVKKLKIKK